ncbi:MAG TPA: efflux RND transporter permease subunit, partial [Myxococcales bacterium]
GIGLYCYTQLDVEAYPNPVAPMIEVITQPQGLSAEEVERYVTIPLETGLAGMLDLEHVRSQSLFGLSDVKCYFNWNPSYVEAQQRVINRLQFIQLPAGAQPQLSPWSAVGEIYRYVLRGRGYSLAELKAAQDWTLERQFRQVPGVVDVVGFGGEMRQVHVDVDPYRLKGHGLTLQQLSSAIGNANQNVGGQRLTLGEQSFNVRGLGLIRSLRDVQQVVVAEQKGVPVRVRDVADVAEGAAPRLGIVGKDLEPDVVQGIVLMRYGGDSLKTLQGVHEKVEQIRKYHLLPPGMTLEPYYDRERLVHLTTHTVIENLLLIAFLVYSAVGTVKDTLLVLLSIPAACAGGVFALLATRTHLSISAAMGFISIFGIAVQDAIIVVTYAQKMWREGRSLEEGARLAAERGLRPALMTASVALIGLLPAALSRGIGSETQKPLAIVVIGGMLVLALLPRLLQPPLLLLLHRGMEQRAHRSASERSPAL